MTNPPYTRFDNSSTLASTRPLIRPLEAALLPLKSPQGLVPKHLCWHYIQFFVWPPSSSIVA